MNAQSPSKVSIFNSQAAIDSSSYTDGSITNWQEMAEFMTVLQSQLMSVISLLSNVFSSDQSTFINIATNSTNPANCSVPSYTTLQTNWTSMQELLCCHIAQQRVTIVPQLLYYANGIYLQIRQTPLDVSLQISEMVYVQQAMRNFSKYITCSQQTSVMIPESQLAMNVAQAPIALQININYDTLITQATTIFGCVTFPTSTTDCVTNQTMTFENFTAFSSQELSYDLSFEDVCSYTALNSLYNDLTNPFCG